MWALVGELPAHTALWATPARLPGGPSQRRIRRGRRRQLRSRCQLALHQPLPAAAEPVSELGWGLAEGRYVLGSSLGAGAYGLVHRGVDRHTGQEVAVKILAKTRSKSTREKTLKKIWREAACLSAVQECNSVARLLDVMEDRDYAYLCLELCNGPNMEQVLETHGPFSERAAAAVAYETLKVISLCHTKAMVHGDIKPSNLMLLQKHADPLTAIASGSVAGGWLKAVDFGCAQAVQQRPLVRRTGTPVFMAPEVFKRQYAYESDLWSLGITLYVLLAGRFPFWETIEDTKHRTLEEVMKAVLLEPLRLDLPPLAGLSRSGRAFLRALLQRDPGLRATAPEALEHAWFREQFGGASMAADAHTAAPLRSSNNIVPIASPAPRCSFYNCTAPRLSAARL